MIWIRLISENIINEMIISSLKKITKFVLKKTLKYYYKLFYPKLRVLKRYSNYDDYVKKQKEKTLDQIRIKRWTGEEWHIKLQGFRELFKRNFVVINAAKNCICLDARTGQEVAILQELGKNAMGIDLVEFPPLTVEGDIHNLSYPDSTFDFVFTNIFDHSLYPDKFIFEMERVCQPGGFIPINLQLFSKGDDYSENIINDPKELINLFKHSKLFYSRSITNTFDEMNWEVAMQKI